MIVDFFDFKIMMTVIWVSLLFMGMVNAYPTTISKRHLSLPRPRRSAVSARSRVDPCLFPFDDPSLAFVPSKDKNPGWVVTSSAPCIPGTSCIYVCRSGYHPQPLFAELTSSGSSADLDGRLQCDASGKLSLPSNTPLCVPDNGNVYIANLFNENIFYCQKRSVDNTPLLASNGLEPGEFSVLDPFKTQGFSTSYYYLSPPGAGSDVACLLETSISSRGDWSPYLLEVTVDQDKNTYIKLSWGFNYRTDEYWGKITPNWGVKIKCEGPDCQGVSCAIDPSRHGVNDCDGKTYGQDGSAFCVVKISRRSVATVLLFSKVNIKVEMELLKRISSQYEQILRKDITTSHTSSEKQHSETKERTESSQHQESTAQQSQSSESQESKEVDQSSKKLETSHDLTKESIQKLEQADKSTASHESEQEDQKLSAEADEFFKKLLSKSQQKQTTQKESDAYMGLVFLGFSENKDSGSEKSLKTFNSKNSDKSNDDLGQLPDSGYISRCFGKMAEFCSLIAQKAASYSKASSKEQLLISTNKTETRSQDRSTQESSAIHILKIHPLLVLITIVMAVFVHFM